MKNKTSKLRNLEKNRYSILTDNMEDCYLCDNKADHIHEIYGAGSRKTSMKNGFCAPLCYRCHTRATLDYETNLYLKKTCQQYYEINNTREDFMKLIKRNYL